MDSTRKKSIIVGILILLAYAILISGFTQSKIVVLLSEAISGITVIGISYLMFPLFKDQNFKLAFYYLTLKLIEGLLMIIAGFFSIFPNSLLFLTRDPIYVIHAYIFIFSAYIFYVLLKKSKLIPNYISNWGKLACASLLIANILEINFSDIKVIKILYLPIFTNEIFLAFRLVAKGFDTTKIKKSPISSRYKSYSLYNL